MRLHLGPRHDGLAVTVLPAVVVAAWLFVAGVAGQTTTVPVYLPGYSDSDWEALRGSVLRSDSAATTFTVFCAEQAPTCQIAGDLPFVFAAGQKTLSYGGSAAGEITADLHCTLSDKTAATCTGSSSFGPNYHQGTISGPTETVWTKTFSGSEVTWGVLTLTTPGTLPATTDIDGTVPTAGVGETTPTTTSGSVAKRQARMSWVAMFAVGAVLMGLRMF
ncbi:hypothetical protein B0H66DRAFT_266164 [Apodospora peruviana]|uniref:Uncharacterized protein n=1 Tax=Apodospora peruviana TaxID=516989 RepID=A0AAE0I6A9_9PEZI|nr:hypothetical protein B0H66DRAFT_266164 [Apodospora peruviana]